MSRGRWIITELFRAFWKELVNPLHESLMQCVRLGKLNPLARHGIINLIPKKGKDETLVKNWRPITLLNYDYKIYAKALANCLEMVTDQLIGKQQNLFIKHRSLVDNLFVTKEVISYLNRKNLPGVIAVVDFKKCFDRIEHNSIKAVFKYFGFGPNFCAMLMLLFKDIELCTSNNGYMSPLFDKGREINQGYPASPLVHAYCGEILNHVIKENSNITGVPFEHLQNILSQFADDTTAFLHFDQNTLNSSSDALYYIEAQLGLKVSYNKMMLYRVGSLQGSRATVYTARNYA